MRSCVGVQVWTWCLSALHGAVQGNMSSPTQKESGGQPLQTRSVVLVQATASV